MDRVSEQRLIRLFVGLEESRFLLTGFEIRGDRWIYRVEPDDRARLCGNCGHEAEKHKKQWVWLKDLPIGIHAKEVWLHVRRYQVWCVSCHGYYVEKMPFRGVNGRITRRLELYIEELVSNKMITVKDLSRMFGLDWDTVYRIDMNLLMTRYQEQEKPHPKNIAVDEKCYLRGRKYLTIITDADLGKVIYVSLGRSKKSLDEFFEWLGKDRCKAIETIAMDLHADYRASANEYCPQALYVPDKFHIVQRLNQAIHDAFRELAFKQNGKFATSIPNDVRWLIRRNLDNQKASHLQKLESLKETNQSLFEAYILKDYFLHFFGFSPHQINEAKEFLIHWVIEAWKTNLRALQDFAEYVKRNQKALLNVILTGRTSSISEGINNKIGKIIAAAYGYKNWFYLSLKILQRCGCLTQPTVPGHTSP